MRGGTAIEIAGERHGALACPSTEKKISARDRAGTPSKADGTYPLKRAVSFFAARRVPIVKILTSDAKRLAL